MTRIDDLFRTTDHITVDCVGDSITFGAIHTDDDGTYVALTAAALAKAYPTVTVRRYDGQEDTGLTPLAGFVCHTVQQGTDGRIIDVIRNGVGGNTVVRAHRRIGDFTGTLANGRQADIITLMFGINDALRSDPAKYVEAEVFKEQYRELIHAIRQTETAHLLIMTATTNDQTIDRHVAMTRELAAEEGIPLVDTNRVWNEHYDPAAPHFGHGDWLSDVPSDACHPTLKGAAAIADCLSSYFLERK